jgi:hypothetical protein
MQATAIQPDIKNRNTAVGTMKTTIITSIVAIWSLARLRL